MALLLETPQAAGNMTHSDSKKFWFFFRVLRVTFASFASGCYWAVPCETALIFGAGRGEMHYLACHDICIKVHVKPR